MSTQKSNRFYSFGLALQEALDIAGVTPAWLSRITGKDKGQISKYINGKIVPKKLTRLELTDPIGYDIIEVDGEWEVTKKANLKNSVAEEKIYYSVEDLGKERKRIKAAFLEVDTLSKLFDEIFNSKSLTNVEKKVQLEMIKEKLAVLLKSILYTKG
ncbi:MAG: hypothetical protein BalsKO_09970 [Balneolaceae bacterium]